MSGTESRFHLSGRELAIIFLFWTSLATLSSVNRLIDPRGFGLGRMMSPTGPILLAFVEAWVWAAFTPLIFWLSSWSSADGKLLRRLPLLLLAGVAVAVVMYLVLDVARGAILPFPARRRGGSMFSPLQGIGRFRFLNQYLVYFAVLAAGFAREYFLRDRRKAEQAAHLQAQLAEARLDALRMQINPHFLFNTLHAISALVERDPAGVRRMIARLSDLLRYTLDKRAADEVTLDDELSFLKRYIEIMEIRFLGRVQVELSVPQDVRAALVPNLVLQPIVENALEHGVSRAGGEGKIEIGARREGQKLLLTVSDDGPGLDEKSETGVGLANTRARLTELYGAAAGITLAARPEGGVQATITIPFHTSGASQPRDAVR